MWVHVAVSIDLNAINISKVLYFISSGKQRYSSSVL